MSHPLQPIVNGMKEALASLKASGKVEPEKLILMQMSIDEIEIRIKSGSVRPIAAPKQSFQKYDPIKEKADRAEQRAARNKV